MEPKSLIRTKDVERSTGSYNQFKAKTHIKVGGGQKRLRTLILESNDCLRLPQHATDNELNKKGRPLRELPSKLLKLKFFLNESKRGLAIELYFIINIRITFGSILIMAFKNKTHKHGHSLKVGLGECY